jgi:ATP adenylyltransferase
MQYIEVPQEERAKRDTLFKELAETTDDKSARIVYRGKHCYIVLNCFPYNAGHLLVVPYKEAANLTDLNHEERNDLMENIVKAQDILTKAMKPEGFNVGFNFGIAAGAGIPKHLHCHVIPRWTGDTNFMPVIGEVRVLPEALDNLWERLRKFA